MFLVLGWLGVMCFFVFLLVRWWSDFLCVSGLGRPYLWAELHAFLGFAVVS